MPPWGSHRCSSDLRTSGSWQTRIQQYVRAPSAQFFIRELNRAFVQLGVEFGSKLITIPEENKVVKLQCTSTQPLCRRAFACVAITLGAHVALVLSESKIMRCSLRFQRRIGICERHEVGRRPIRIARMHSKFKFPGAAKCKTQKVVLYDLCKYNSRFRWDLRAQPG